MEDSALEAELVEDPSSVEAPMREPDRFMAAWALTSWMEVLIVLKIDFSLLGVFKGSPGGTNPSISRLAFNSLTYPYSAHHVL
jgi:hypothetical protein